jgi:hypothetical protein
MQRWNRPELQQGKKGRRGVHPYTAVSVVFRLGQTEPVPKRTFKDRFHAVELIFRFGDELHD